MRACIEAHFLKDVEHHAMSIIREDGVCRHVRFRKPGTICMGFDLIAWPGHLCYTGDMGTYVFSRTNDMFEFFRTDRKQPWPGNALHVNLGYWAQKVLAQDKNGGIKAYDQDRAEVMLKEALRDMRRDGRKTAEERGEIYDEVMESIESEEAFHLALRDHFDDSWEWDLTDYTYGFIWCCHAIAWGIQIYDNNSNKQEIQPCRSSMQKLE